MIGTSSDFAVLYEPDWLCLNNAFQLSRNPIKSLSGQTVPDTDSPAGHNTHSRAGHNKFSLLLSTKVLSEMSLIFGQ